LEWKVTQKPLTQLAVDGIVVLHTEGGEADGEDVKEVDEVLDFRISRLIADGETTGKYGEITLLHTWDKIPAKRVFVLGLGKAEELDVDRLRQGFAIVARKAEERGLKHLGIALPASFAAEKNAADLVQAAVEGVELGAYRYRGYKGDSREASLTSIFLSLSDLSRSGVEAGLERGRCLPAPPIWPAPGSTSPPIGSPLRPWRIRPRRWRSGTDSRWTFWMSSGSKRCAWEDCWPFPRGAPNLPG